MNTASALPPRRRARWPAICIVLTAAIGGQPACADEFDAFNFVLSTSVSNDANVFRTADSAVPPTGFANKSDRIETTSVGFKIDKPYALQRFQFSLAEIATRFSAFTFLNSDATNYRGAWLWALTPHLTGTLSVDQTQSQSSFAQIGGTQRNLRKNNNRLFSVDSWVAGGWHLLAGFGDSDSSSEQANLSQPSFHASRLEAGLRYVAVSGNSINFTQRSMPTQTVNQALDPVNFIDTNYRDTESELKINWKPSGQSSFDGTLTRKARRNANFAQRDFAGIAGDLRYLWTPTGKLQFSVGIGRNIMPYLAFGNALQNSSYEVDQTQSVSSTLQVDARLSINLNFTRKVSDFRGAVFAVTSPARSDVFRSAQIGVNWSPLRSVTLSASLERDRRDTNVSSFQYYDTVSLLSAAATF